MTTATKDKGSKGKKAAKAKATGKAAKTPKAPKAKAPKASKVPAAPEVPIGPTPEELAAMEAKGAGTPPEAAVEPVTALEPIAPGTPPTAPQESYQLTEQGLVVKEGLSFDDWYGLGIYLLSISKSIQWLVGDWIIYGENQREWGDKYSQAMDATKLSYQTLANYRWVAGAIPMEQRHPELSWGHHETVASMTAEQQQHWLGLAAEGKWSVATLRDKISGAGVKAGIESKAADPLKKIKAIYLKLSDEQSKEFRDWIKGGAKASA